MRKLSLSISYSKVFVGVAVSLIFLPIAVQGLAKEKTLVLASMNWEPVCAKSLPDGGVYTALTQEAFRRVGYRTEVKFVPWARAEASTKAGKYDVLMIAVMNSNREPFFIATEVILPFNSLLISRSEDTITYTHLSELKSYKIGTIRGTGSEEILKKAGLTVQPVSTSVQNFRKLMLGRIDLMQASNFTISQILKKNPDLLKFKGKTKAVSPPIHSKSLVNLISKKHSDHASIAVDFNRGLQEIITDGTFNAIVKKHGFSDFFIKKQ